MRYTHLGRHGCSSSQKLKFSGALLILISDFGCKGTAFFRHVQIFYKENAICMLFCYNIYYLRMDERTVVCA
jgi:hypothetical protein